MFALPIRTGVKAVEAHDLVPGGDEGVDEVLFGVGGGADLGRVAHPFGVLSRKGGVSLAVASDRSLLFSLSPPTRRKDGRAVARYPTLCQSTAKDGPPGLRPTRQ